MIIIIRKKKRYGYEVDGTMQISMHRSFHLNKTFMLITPLPPRHQLSDTEVVIATFWASAKVISGERLETGCLHPMSR